MCSTSHAMLLPDALMKCSESFALQNRFPEGCLVPLSSSRFQNHCSRERILNWHSGTPTQGRPDLNGIPSNLFILSRISMVSSFLEARSWCCQPYTPRIHPLCTRLRTRRTTSARESIVCSILTFSLYSIPNVIILTHPAVSVILTAKLPSPSALLLSCPGLGVSD